MVAIKGSCDPAFKKLADELAANIESQEELGASICVNIDGKDVVDIWGGHTDEERKKEWDENTIINVWSCSKTVTNLAVLIAADRGLLDVHDKISKHWPEFAQNGKENIEIRHILSHSTGVPAWEQPITAEDICDVEKSTVLLAKQAPWWEPGTASGYHLLSQGHLGGELIRRVTGKSLKRFIAEEVAGPLGADFQLGATEEDWNRISTLIPPPDMSEILGAMDPTSIPIRALTGPAPGALFALTPAWRGGEIGAANGHGNARSLNRIMSAVTLGGVVYGVSLLSQKTIDKIFQEQTNGTDYILGHPVRFGIGYGLPLKEAVPVIPDGKKCFWGGWGGSSVIMDVDNRMTFTYVMNKMGGGTLGTPRTLAYISAAYDALKNMDNSSKI